MPANTTVDEVARVLAEELCRCDAKRNHGRHTQWCDWQPTPALVESVVRLRNRAMRALEPARPAARGEREGADKERLAFAMQRLAADGILLEMEPNDDGHEEGWYWHTDSTTVLPVQPTAIEAIDAAMARAKRAAEGGGE